MSETDAISYVSGHGTLTWIRRTEAAAVNDPDLLADGYLFGPTDLTATYRELLTGTAPHQVAEVRYGHWYQFSGHPGRTLPDVLAAMLLTGPGHLDAAGWDVLAGHLDTLPAPTIPGGAPAIR